MLNGIHPTIAAALAPHVLTPRLQASLVIGIQSRCGRRRTYPTQALANDYDRGYCAFPDDHAIVSGSPASDGWYDRESEALDRADRDEVCDA